MVLKKCKTCRKELPIAQFYSRPSKPNYRDPHCIPCHNKRHKGYYQNNKTAVLATIKRSRIKGMYGLEWSEYQAMIDGQGGRCKICEQPFVISSSYSYTTSPNVDHCHATGKVRGILCGYCNRGIGHLKDDVRILERAIKYLKEEL